MFFFPCVLLSCLSFCRINLYQVVVESTAPWKSSKRLSPHTHWALTSTSLFVTEQRDWLNPEPRTNLHVSTQYYQWHYTLTATTHHVFLRPQFSLHPGSVSHYTSLWDYTRGNFLGHRSLDYSLFGRSFSLHQTCHSQYSHVTMALICKQHVFCLA